MQRVTGWTGLGLGLMLAFALGGCKEHSDSPVTENATNPSASTATTSSYAANPFPKGATDAQMQAGITQITNDPNMTPQQKTQAIGVLKSHFHTAGPSGAK